MSSELDIAQLSPLFGVASKSEPDYLEYDIRGRGYMEKCFYNCGVSYLAGMTVGGIWGLSEGFGAATWRIRTNQMMNGFGKRGANFGNATGAMALMYTTFENFGDRLDQPPAFAGVLTGVLYKSTAGPRAILLAGLLGGLAAQLLAISPISLR